MKGSPIRGAVCGLLFGLFLGLFVLTFGLVATDSILLVVLPVLFLVVGIAPAVVAGTGSEPRPPAATARTTPTDAVARSVEAELVEGRPAGVARRLRVVRRPGTMAGNVLRRGARGSRGGTAGRAGRFEQRGVAHDRLEVDLVALDRVGLAVDRAGPRRPRWTSTVSTPPTSSRQRRHSAVQGTCTVPLTVMAPSIDSRVTSTPRSASSGTVRRGDGQAGQRRARAGRRAGCRGAGGAPSPRSGGPAGPSERYPRSWSNTAGPSGPSSS